MLNMEQRIERGTASQQWGGQAGRSGAEPVIPLPEVGAGGPVYPGNMDNTTAEPVIPLPSPGEGGPVYPGDMDTGTTTPVEPVIPLPSPGEGGPVYPGNGGGSTGGGQWVCPGGICGGVAVLPGIIGTLWPTAAKVRFLHAAYNYPALRVFINQGRFVNLLNYASATNYGQVAAGYQTVTLMGTDGYIYLQKTMPFQANGISTMAIINTASGIDLLQIPDTCCPPAGNFGSLRIGNLAYNTTPMDVIMSDGRVVYADLRFKEVGAFKRIVPGTYQFFYADTSLMPMPASADIETLDSAWLGVYPPQETFGSLYLNVRRGIIYTVYLLQSGSGRNQIQNLILMDS